MKSNAAEQMSKMMTTHDLKKAIQTMKMAHQLLEHGYRFDDEKGPKMLRQLKWSIDLLEKRIRRAVM